MAPSDASSIVGSITVSAVASLLTELFSREQIIINRETSTGQTESEKSLPGKNKTDVYKLIISFLWWWNIINILLS